ncbi:MULTISPECIES: hypothetical protein [Halocynthiibacter]|uniref:Uncharacterized protein n=1 Tax=Halocynthiibacter halioticoli TaxID=2986804 RepID=A0AAE3J136_9RHOB|nr:MULTISPECIES: hypothetical protein [Halocynthiibacter]MCV6823292.1 hypothetical protein [Halocynthiibacter halioticoli]MCW4056293.1 hypothetical protein [Halocynthiibacter sp. SDUM655004]
MKQAIVVLLCAAALASCTRPDPYPYPVNPEDPYIPDPYYDANRPVVGGDLYIGSGGMGGRVGISSGNFGLSIGF